MEKSLEPGPYPIGRSAPRRRRFGNRVVVAALLLVVAIIGAVGLAPRLWSATFGFLHQKTGWDISFSFLPYSAGDPYWWVFLVGLANTVGTGAIAICSATLVGFAVGVARLSRNHLLADLARIYVDVIRNIPLILQAAFWYAVVLHLPPMRAAYSFLDAIFLSNRGLFLPKFDEMTLVIACLVLVSMAAWWLSRFMRSDPDDPTEKRRTLHALYAALSAVAAAGLAALNPSAFNIDWPVRAGLNFQGGMRLAPEFVALLVAITIYRGAFIAEVFRGGLQSVSIGQLDAARSLGLRPWMVLLKIRLPLALISIVPALSSEFIIIMKVTSIGIVVGFWDLFAVSSNSAMMTGQTLEVLFVMILIYIALNYAIVSAMNLVNARMRLPGNDR